MSTGRLTSLRRALIGLAAVGVVLGLVMAVVAATSDHETTPGMEAALTLIVAWSFLGTGLYSWDGRPDNLTGPLMVAVGFTLGLASSVLYLGALATATVASRP